MEHSPVPGEAKDKLIREAYSRIQAYEERGVPAGDALSEIASWLIEQKEVSQVLTYHTDLTLRFTDGTQVGLLFGRKQAYGPPAGLRRPPADSQPPEKEAPDEEESDPYPAEYPTD